MSQAVATLSRNLISISVCILLAACNGSYTAFESDVDFDVDVKTADIELDNVELMTLSVFQAAFLGHYQTAAYLFLDASDEIPESFSETTTNNKFDCENINDNGTATYTFTRPAGDIHKVGDSVSVEYVNCKHGANIYNGRLSAKYTKLRGLNTRFVTLSTNECVDILQKELSVNDVDIIYVTGDELRFTKVSDQLKVDVFLFEDSSSEDDARVETLKGTYNIQKNDEAIFILRPTNLAQDAVTSVNGDQVYSIVDAIGSKENCQHFERTLSVQLSDFSTNKVDYLYTSLNGSVTLFDAQENENIVKHSLINSNFKTTVKQGNSTETFTMKDYRVEKTVSVPNKTYSYEFEGLISNSNVIGGQIQLTNTNKLLGSSYNDYPSAGAFEFKAQGLERVVIIPNNLRAQLQVDYNGDSTGNSLSDFDIYIDTMWVELFAREFEN